MIATASRRGRTRRVELAKQEEQDPSPAVWPGVLGGRYKPLSDQEVENVVEASLRLLETLGLSQATKSMIEKVVARGGTLRPDRRLLFPRDLVLEMAATARRDITLHARRPGWDLDISGARVHMSSGGGAPNVVDLETGLYRPGRARDLYNAARVCDAMEHVHHFSRSIVASDAADPLEMDVNTLYACLAGTRKHVSISVSEPENVPAIAEICYRLAGGEDAFRARPFVTVMVCHVVPPMRFAEEAIDTLEAAVLAGFPVQLISAGQAGATSPASVAGSLVQAIAETLAGFVFARLVDPNAAAIFAPKPLVADLRTGAMCGGGAEQAILMAGAAQIGRHFDLPTSSIAGITDSKLADTQHGAEKTLAVSLSAHAGSNIVTQACGMQASLLGVSLEAYVADNDMLGNILRSIRGIEATPENLSADVIASVCEGPGHYLDDPETIQRMKRDYVYPSLGDRQPPRVWEEEGSIDLRTRARAKMNQVLNDHHPMGIDAASDHWIRENFNILVPKDAMRPGSPSQ